VPLIVVVVILKMEISLNEYCMIGMVVGMFLGLCFIVII
jgi:hypothetical protein